ncbi:MAG: alanyl-tRNA editing protein, partial [Chloroflexota bacterium]
MTERLYNYDAYLSECEARVTDVSEDGVVLNRTVFYPGGGGQPNDTGMLIKDGRETPVTKVSGKGGLIVHEAPHGALDTGDVVTCRIDWDTRHKLMRTHTALHILCGVVWRDYGAQVTGGNMSPLKGRMDFEFESLRSELIDEIQRAVNEEVAADRPVDVDFISREEAENIPDLIRTKINLVPAEVREIRTINIRGLDLQADGGTHVRSTGEVGAIRIAGH